MHCSTGVAGRQLALRLSIGLCWNKSMVVLAVDSIITTFIVTVVPTAVCLSEVLAKGYKVRLQRYIGLHKVTQGYTRLQG